MTRWRGYVVMFDDKVFTVRFEERPNTDYDFDLARLPPADREHLQAVGPGTHVHLVIEDVGGTETARLEFPRDRWTQEELDALLESSDLDEIFAHAEALTVVNPSNPPPPPPPAPPTRT